MTNQERAAEVILKAEYEHRGHTCDLYTDTHVYAKALADAGLLAPDLPEPSYRNHRGLPIWETGGGTKIMTPRRLPVSLSGPFGEGWDMHPIEARDIAYALLAAAKLAEEQK